MQRIQLPPETVLKNSRQGIPRELQVAHNIITKCAKYSETTIKLLATLSEGRVTTSDLEKLFTVQYAEVKFLQDELAALIVQGQFDPGTSKLFKALPVYNVIRRCSLLKRWIISGVQQLYRQQRHHHSKHIGVVSVDVVTLIVEIVTARTTSRTPLIGQTVEIVASTTTINRSDQMTIMMQDKLILLIIICFYM